MLTLTEMLGANDEHWMDNPDRNCLGPSDAPLDIQLHANAWFPGETHGRRGAEKLCEGCPVRTECLTYALAHPELEGVWGGTTETGRKTLRKGAAA